MPWDYRPWGCGSGRRGSCNNGWIQFEICEDALTDKAYFEAVYKEACELTAYLCKMFSLNPQDNVSFNGVSVPVILCHQDSYKLGLGSNHGDVYNWFNKYGKTSLIMLNVPPKSVVTTALNSSNDNSSTRPSFIPIPAALLIKTSIFPYFSATSTIKECIASRLVKSNE